MSANISHSSIVLPSPISSPPLHRLSDIASFYVAPESCCVIIFVFYLLYFCLYFVLYLRLVCDEILVLFVSLMPQPLHTADRGRHRPLLNLFYTAVYIKSTSVLSNNFAQFSVFNLSEILYNFLKILSHLSKLGQRRQK